MIGHRSYNGGMSSSAASRAAISPVEIVRAAVLVAALATLGLWGFTGWPAPWSFVVGIGAPVLALVVWALFLSPRPVLHVHPFVRAVVELLIYASATVCWWMMDLVWVGLGFAVVAVAAGLVAGRRALA